MNLEGISNISEIDPLTHTTRFCQEGVGSDMGSYYHKALVDLARASEVRRSGGNPAEILEERDGVYDIANGMYSESIGKGELHIASQTLIARAFFTRHVEELNSTPIVTWSNIYNQIIDKLSNAANDERNLANNIEDFEAAVAVYHEAGVNYLYMAAVHALIASRVTSTEERRRYLQDVQIDLDFADECFNSGRSTRAVEIMKILIKVSQIRASESINPNIEMSKLQRALRKAEHYDLDYWVGVIEYMIENKQTPLALAL